MIITIDTSKDTKEELRAAIKLLSELTGQTVNSVSEPVDPVSNEGASAFGAMFGDSSPSFDSSNMQSEDLEPKDDDFDDNPAPSVDIMTY